MSRIVEINYDPYISKSSILIDSKPIAEYSRLVQFTDEDIWDFNQEILEAIDQELREDFVLAFQGRPEDAMVLRHQAENTPNCKGFNYREFQVNEPLQQRLGQLNQYLKRSGQIPRNPSTIEAEFIISPDLKDLEPVLSGLDIKNAFTQVKPVIQNSPSTSGGSKESKFYFIINTDLNAALKIASNIPRNFFIFIIIVGNSNKGLVKIDNLTYIYEETLNDVIPTVYSCLLYVPLLVAFRNQIRNLPNEEKESRQIKRILATQPIIDVKFDPSIESGRSNKIKVSYEPKVANPPQITYKIMDEKIAGIHNDLIAGKEPGETTVEVYRVGEKEPFVTFPINVYKRNRITSLTLSDYELFLGEGDSYNLGMQYFPKDADNVNTITWKSSNDDVISVNNGRLQAKKTGSGRIICTAENVSKQCQVNILPYLESITTGVELGQDGMLHLEPAQEVPLDLQLYPATTIDGELRVDSSNFDVVNVVRGIIIAKGPGTAEVTVRNASGSKRIVIPVQVKKKGFFQRLFGN